MRILSVLLPFLSASLVASKSFSVFSHDQAPLANSFDVPGKNPLKFCGNPKNYILDIDKVDLDPNPPKSNSNLTITASGSFSEDVADGATVALTVKYGLITLIKTTADLCSQIKEVDLECPLKKGKMSMVHDVKIPREVPPGQYTVIANVVSKDAEPITCLETTVHF
ncbi:hypothetical protein EPUS_06043 [Endocarpon pusillum Z07020]|uniref:Phosphatidylglycerol/phosphatidylinositol transfer protein n=1 Tax=Endocarpon pusillum (strain Z07020 / HMAS-L-300199) TaxID=1263415 RepID=U1HT37_ENDPU|nr:uncharacterized protein EPUS_06043 [Endocarpon pusillum Z07020]ERF72414.1 hypothetical protein EPUS_06043 [Endocarpon pusillum Z07020]